MTNVTAQFVSTSTLSTAVKTQAIAIDNRLLDNRYAIELAQVNTIKSAYDQRSAKIALDRKYACVREALFGLYDLGIQHNCNLSDLLVNFDVVVGSAV